MPEKVLSNYNGFYDKINLSQNHKINSNFKDYCNTSLNCALQDFAKKKDWCEILSAIENFGSNGFIFTNLSTFSHRFLYFIFSQPIPMWSAKQKKKVRWIFSNISHYQRVLSCQKLSVCINLFHLTHRQSIEKTRKYL